MSANWARLSATRAALFSRLFRVVTSLIQIARTAIARCCLRDAAGALRVCAAHAMRQVLSKHQQHDEQRFEAVAISEHRCRPWLSNRALTPIKVSTGTIGHSLQINRGFLLELRLAQTLALSAFASVLCYFIHPCVRLLAIKRRRVHRVLLSTASLAICYTSHDVSRPLER